MRTVAICSSADFYKKVVEIQKELEDRAIKSVIPETARKMKQAGNFDASYYRTWLKDDNDYHKKTRLMLEHFKEIEQSDAILVVNEKKHGQDNYIGGNVLIEMAIAMYLKKPIYILNNTPERSPFLEEILAMQPTILNGKLENLMTDLLKDE